MSKPLFEDYVSVSTRRNRKSFIFNLLLLWLGFVIVFFAIIAATDLSSLTGLVVASGFSVVLILAFMAAEVMLAVQRGNDIGLRRDLVAAVMLAPILTLTLDLNLSGIARLYGVTALIPHETVTTVINVAINTAAFLLLLYLIFKRGQKGPNQWGDDPLDEWGDSA